MDEKLSDVYPLHDIIFGRSGGAVVELTVLADGRARVGRTVSHTSAAFARACREALRSSHWIPAFDERGHAVEDVVQFECTFTAEGEPLRSLGASMADLDPGPGAGLTVGEVVPFGERGQHPTDKRYFAEMFQLVGACFWRQVQGANAGTSSDYWVAFRIGESGHVTDAAFIESAPDDATTHRCVTSALRGWVFWTDGHSEVVSVKFRISSKASDASAAE